MPSVSSSSIASHASRLLGATAPAQRKVPSAEHENGSDGRASPADGLQHLKPVPPQRRDRAGEEDDDSTRGKGVTGGMRGRPGSGGEGRQRSGGNARPMGSDGKRRQWSPSTRQASPDRGRWIAGRPASPNSAVKAEAKSNLPNRCQREVHENGGEGGAETVACEENGDGGWRLSESASFDQGRCNSGGGNECPEGSYASHRHRVAGEINGQSAMQFGGDGCKVQASGLNLHSVPTTTAAATAGSKGRSNAQPQLTPRGAKTELVALISEAMFGGNV